MLKNQFFNNKGPFPIDKLLKLSGTLNSKIYKALQISYKANDKKRIIVSVVGVKSYPNNINKCIN